jgi:tetratricopeptide (TPR) repeat protein
MSATSHEPFCFVVMGYGKKTDFESGKTFDLDATYRAIIKPSVAAAGLRCVRSDEVKQSGVIDIEMYQMLLQADLVIADISTSNANAIYELGVRHALRPFSTIVMCEGSGRLHFDLNHVSTLKYRHLGEDVGHTESQRASAELTATITKVMTNRTDDSPVYTFLPKLNAPTLSEDRIEEIIEDAIEYQERLSACLEEAEAALNASEFITAIKSLKRALVINPHDSHIIQRLTLATYKSELPSPNAALVEALVILSVLKPDLSNDPETLGLAGAIHKRLWKLTGDLAHLHKSVAYYKNGFEVRKDYYNGENLAFNYDVMAAEMGKKRDQLEGFFRESARQVRAKVIERLLLDVEDADFGERPDKIWMYATLANCSFGLGEIETGEKYEVLFHGENPAKWQIETYDTQKTIVLESNAPSNFAAVTQL